MPPRRGSDIEGGREYKPLDAAEVSLEESEALLAEESVKHGEPSSYHVEPRPQRTQPYAVFSAARFNLLHLFAASAVGFVACLGFTFLFPSLCFSRPSTMITQSDTSNLLASPDAGSTQVHNYPPLSPTNGDTSLFPTNIGYAGITPTGAEAAVVQTAPIYPIHTGAPNLVTPKWKDASKGSKKGSSDMFKKWGNLSPWYSIERGTFGIDSGPEAPEQCTVTGLHFLHRHGARYPTAWGK